MSFGESLKDQLPVINNYTHNGIVFVNELRDFMKEMASLKKEYAHRMDQLAKRYLKQKEKLGASLLGSESSPASSTTTVDYGSVYRVWDSLLTQSEKIANIYSTLSESITTDIADPLKSVALKQDEARKKHLNFAQKLMEERNKAYTDKDKSKEKYEQSCDQVEAARIKYEKAPDEKNQERLKKLWQAEIMEMNNIKNNYILTVHTANSFKVKYFQQDIPTLMDQMQELNESRVYAVQRILKTYVDLLNQASADVQTQMTQLGASVSQIQPKEDSQLFIKNHTEVWQEPYPFVFEPSLLWKDDDHLVVDEPSKIYLTNKLAKVKVRLDDVEQEIQAKQKEVNGLVNLRDAYRRNPSTGDPDEVNEKCIETLRQITILNGTKARYTTSMNVIVGAIGETHSGKRHTLTKASFAIPTACDYCQEKIWGLTQQGFTCKDCGYNCHAKCELKVPPYCELTKEARLARSVSIHSNVSSPGILGVASNSNIRQSASNLTRISSLANVQPDPVWQAARATYTYEATTNDELTIQEGQWLEIQGAGDASGWVHAKLNGKEGLVPYTYISIGLKPNAGEGISKRVRALYDYEARSPDELTIKEGDIIEVISTGEDGWSEGMLNGRKGNFPTNYADTV